MVINIKKISENVLMFKLFGYKTQDSIVSTVRIVDINGSTSTG